MFWVNWQKNSFWNHHCHRNWSPTKTTATKGNNIKKKFLQLWKKNWYNITTLQHWQCCNVVMLYNVVFSPTAFDFLINEFFLGNKIVVIKNLLHMMYSNLDVLNTYHFDPFRSGSSFKDWFIKNRTNFTIKTLLNLDRFFITQFFSRLICRLLFS